MTRRSCLLAVLCLSAAPVRAQRLAAPSTAGRLAASAAMRPLAALPPGMPAGLPALVQVGVGVAPSVASANVLAAPPVLTAAAAPAAAVARYRAVWISDTHLGTSETQTDLLLDFLRGHESEYLYLVGDIMDGYRLKRDWKDWTTGHSEVAAVIAEKAARGTRVIYVPGDHDQKARPHAGQTVDGVRVELDAIHTTADGRRLWVVHGDRFDRRETHARAAVLAGIYGQRVISVASRWVNNTRRRLGLPFWPMSMELKLGLQTARDYIAGFEAVMLAEAARRGLDGVITGHMHLPILKDVGGMTFAIDGDWVETCAALVERLDGSLALVENRSWREPTARRPATQPSASE